MLRASTSFFSAAGLGLLLGGCGHALTSIPGFQAAAWKADTYACHNQRVALLPPLLAARAQLYEARATPMPPARA